MFGKTNIQCFSRWNSDVQNAYASLPQNPFLSDELLRRLLDAGSMEKAIVIVSVDGETQGLVPLRSIARNQWVPLAQGIVEFGAPCVSSTADALSNFVAANKTVRHILFRGRVGRGKSVRHLDPMVGFTLEVAHSERYWRSTGTWRNIVKAKNKAGNWKLAIDDPRAWNWVLEKWAEKWSRQDDIAPGAAVVARYFEERGQLRTFTVERDGRSLSGMTAIENQDTLHLMQIYRRPDQETYTLFSSVIAWAADNGFKNVDFGPGQTNSYKRVWAPQGDSYTNVDISPALRFWPREFKNGWRRYVSRRAP